jgi:hypothetical protein
MAPSGAEALLEPSHVLRRDVADRVQTTARKLLLSLATHPPQARQGQLRQEADRLIGTYFALAIRLG